MTLATKAATVFGTVTDGDTEATAGSLAKAINDVVHDVAATIESITVFPRGWNQITPSAQVAVAIIIYT